MNLAVSNRFIEIGRIGRARGLQGEVRFQPDKIFTAVLFERISIFYWRNRRSDLIPIRLMEYRIENKQNQKSFFVKFDAITNRNEAEDAADRAIFADRSAAEALLEDKVTENDDLAGYSVICGGKRQGEVLDVLENPAHSILQIRYQSGSLLIPFVDEYVENVDHESAAVYCKNLDQLT